MRVGIFGSGYVGLVTAACLADVGHTVVCGDCNAARIAQLQRGENPLCEPGLEALLRNHLASGRLQFTADLKEVVQGVPLCIVAVGTPSSADGTADLSAVESVADTIARALQAYAAVLIKSTVPAGTARRMQKRIRAQLALQGCTFAVDVASNPEFLREGTAVDDCQRPERIVVGLDNSPTDKLARASIEQLYASFTADAVPLLWMDTPSSEVTKYAANAMLATRISFVNQMAELCQAVGADIMHVRRGMAGDARIGGRGIDPGIGYGGACLPKDLQALLQAGRSAQLELPLLQAVQAVNACQHAQFVARITAHFGGTLVGRRLAVWGLAFKPGTDDVREAPALRIVQQLHRNGATLCAHDPAANAAAARTLGALKGLSYAADPLAAVANADALCILTEWPQFAEVDIKTVLAAMRKPVIFDGRHALDTRQVRALDAVVYMAPGRPNIVRNTRTASANALRQS
jgi:UDPglucose 6-dehydrogenase